MTSNHFAPLNRWPINRRSFLASSALAGLASTRLSQARAQDATEISFFGFSGSEVQLRPAWEAFAEENPGVTVAASEVPFVDYQNTLVQRFSSGDSGIDIFAVDPTYIPTFAEQGFLFDLTDTFGSEAEVAFNPTNVQGSRYEGRMLTVPIWDSTQVLFYNSALLEQANIALPSSDPAQRLTWEELIDLAKQAQAAGAMYGFAFDQVDRYYQLQPLPESLGGGPGVTGDDLLTVDITNEAWMKAGEWYASIYRDGVAPKDLTVGAETGAAFEAGQIAFFLAGPWNVPGFIEAGSTAGLEFGIAAHPYFSGGEALTPSESWHLGLSVDAPNQAEALELMRFCGLTASGNLLTSTQGSLPAHVEASEQFLAAQEASNPALEGWEALVTYELANTAILRPRTLGYLQLEELVSRAWADIRLGLDVRETFERTQGELESAFERIGR